MMSAGAMLRAGRGRLGMFLTSSLVLGLGFCLYSAGVFWPEWRREMGYSYGLWVRCEGDACTAVSEGWQHYLTLVQAGIVWGLVLLGASMICLLLEGILRVSNMVTRDIHARRLSRIAIVTITLADIVAATSLAYYGHKTVMARERLPALSTGFALTGLGILVTLMGNILKLLGPPSTWERDVPCLSTPRGHKNKCSGVSQQTGSLHPSVVYYDKLATKEALSGKSKRGQTSSQLFCCWSGKKGFSYSSAPSTLSSSTEKGYRHYEEINFDDIPPPPLELLYPGWRVGQCREQDGEDLRDPPRRQQDYREAGRAAQLHSGLMVRYRDELSQHDPIQEPGFSYHRQALTESAHQTAFLQYMTAPRYLIRQTESSLHPQHFHHFHPANAPQYVPQLLSHSGLDFQPVQQYSQPWPGQQRQVVEGCAEFTSPLIRREFAPGDEPRVASTGFQTLPGSYRSGGISRPLPQYNTFDCHRLL